MSKMKKNLLTLLFTIIFIIILSPFFMLEVKAPSENFGDLQECKKNYFNTHFLSDVDCPIFCECEEE